MNRPAVVFSALLPLVLFCSVVKAQSPSSDGHFVVLAHGGEITQQRGSIPPTTLFSPEVSGLYRVSAYVEVTGPTSVSVSVCPSLSWTDDSMSLQANPNLVTPFAIADPCAQTNQNVAFSAGGSTIIRAVANTPVTLAVPTYPTVFPDGSPSYSLFITVERLSPL
jgi:hypothetical protein